MLTLKNGKHKMKNETKNILHVLKDLRKKHNPLSIGILYITTLLDNQNKIKHHVKLDLKRSV